MHHGRFCVFTYDKDAHSKRVPLCNRFSTFKITFRPIEQSAGTAKDLHISLPLQRQQLIREERTARAYQSKSRPQHRGYWTLANMHVRSKQRRRYACPNSLYNSCAEPLERFPRCIPPSFQKQRSGEKHMECGGELLRIRHLLHSIAQLADHALKVPDMRTCKVVNIEGFVTRLFARHDCLRLLRSVMIADLSRRKAALEWQNGDKRCNRPNHKSGQAAKFTNLGLEPSLAGVNEKYSQNSTQGRTDWIRPE